VTKFKVSISRYTLANKLAPGHPAWKNFNAGFDNVELSDIEIMKAVNHGQAITTWHKDNWRTSENFICGQHIGLDFDSGTKASSMDCLAKDSFIAKYANFLYTTVSHTQEEPRSRVIFLLDKPIQQAVNYTNAVRSLLWLFDSADRQCKDAVRFFYGSLNCEMKHLGNVLTIDKIKKIIADYQESSKREQKPKLKNFTATATQTEVYEALKLIPPWQVDYEEWVNILMGIHSEFGDDGFSMAESWADGKQGEVLQKWKSFKDNGNPVGKVTIATVFGIAKRFGWKHEQIIS